MDIASHHYYKCSKTLLTMLNLWSCDKGWSTQLLKIFTCLLLASGPTFQLTVCVTTKCTGDVLLSVVSYMTPTIMFFLKYVTICFKVETIFDTFDQIGLNWKNAKDDQETNILKKYSEFGRWLTIGFTMFMWAPIVVFFLYPFASTVLDIFIPLNESRPHRFPMRFEYFVDQEKYFYFVSLHAYLFITVGAIALTANESLTILLVCHTCALFKIVSYRMKRINNQESQSQSAVSAKQYATHKRIIDALQAHKRALQFGDDFVKNYIPAYLGLLALGVVAITLCLYRLQRMMLLKDDMLELVITIFYLSASLIYLLFTNFLGQLAMDLSASIFIDTYCAPWYAISSSAKQMLQISMEKSRKGWAISVCGLYVPCFEGFATIMRMSMSYFMALRSLQ